MFAVGPRIGPDPHLTFVVDGQAVERNLGGQARRRGRNVEAVAALAPTIAEIDILVDMRFIEIDQRMAFITGAIEQRADLSDEAFAPLGISAPKQLLGLLPREVQPPQGAADGLTAVAAAEPLPYERDQTLECRARFRIGSGYGWCGCGLPGGTDFVAKRSLDLRAKGGRPAVRR
jgi:hypothetical protein